MLIDEKLTATRHGHLVKSIAAAEPSNPMIESILNDLSLIVKSITGADNFLFWRILLYHYTS